MVAEIKNEQLLVVADTAGEFFRIFPDGSACEICDENDLRDVRVVAELRPVEGHADRIVGPSLEIIAWARCAACDGTGTFKGTCVCVEEFDDDHGPFVLAKRPWQPGHSMGYREFVDDDRSCACPTCAGSGFDYRWTGVRVPHLPLGRLITTPRAVPDFATELRGAA